jgi:aerobic-type carbon monoxide dehydrogenase small subunit (CoxS/CutS family)
MDIDVAAGAALRGPWSTPVVLTVNGERRVVELEPRVSLLDALREHLGLTGTKKGCDQGGCGAWSDEAIAELMSGNLCRCAAYPNIRAAIRQVRDAE